MSHGSVRKDALVDLEAHVAVGDGREIAPEAPGARPIAPAHFEHVTEAARRDHSDAAPLRSRSALVPTVVPWTIEPMSSIGPRRFEPLDEPDRLVAAVRGRLGDREVSLGFVEPEESVKVPPTSTPTTVVAFLALALKPGVPRAGSCGGQVHLAFVVGDHTILFARNLGRKIA